MTRCYRGLIVFLDLILTPAVAWSAISAPTTAPAATSTPELLPETAAVEAVVAATADPNEVVVHWRNGLQFTTAGGDIHFQLNGRLQVDAAQISDEKLTEPDAPGVPGGPGSQGGIELRRARLELGGTYGNHIAYRFQVDFASSDLFKDNYIALQDLPGNLSLRFGKMYEPFSMDDLTSSKYTTFMERALPVAFSPNRHFGFAVKRVTTNERLTYSAGIFKNDPVAEGNWALTGRITGLPYASEAGVFHLGVAYSYRNVDILDYSQRPESHLAATLVDTGGVTVDHIMLGAAELALALGPVHAQGEYVLSSAETTAGPSVLLDGWYAQAGVFLTGERRSYKASDGTFSRTKPKRTAFVDGGWGAWELAARVSAIDLNDGVVAGGKLTDYSLALNAYLTPHVRWMLNYVATVPEAWETAHITQMRAQVEF